MKLIWDFREFGEFANRLQRDYELQTMLMTATQEVARALHSELLTLTPVDTGNLRKMWSAGDNLKFTVQKVADGFIVEFINEASNDGFMYGVAVNDGHRSRAGNWVVGRFFVEKSIVEVSDSGKLESIIYKQLQKWWKDCLNG